MVSHVLLASWATLFLCAGGGKRNAAFAAFFVLLNTLSKNTQHHE
jgi:hypothetical protein